MCPVALPELVNAIETQRRRRIAAALLLARREWLTIGEDLDAGWRRVGPRLSIIVAGAQLGAARDGVAVVPAALGAGAPAPDAAVRPEAFAGVTDQGNPLEVLLYGGVVHAKAAEARSFGQRLELGWTFVSQAATTQIADAGRGATRVGVVTRPDVAWVRIANPPCCKRCAVLGGRVYRWSKGFDRHPGCDCTMLPQTVANPLAPGLDVQLDDIRDLTKKERAAIEAGGDFNKVLNTSARSTSRDLRAARLDRIIRQARTRSEAVELLARSGYAA